MLKVDNLHVYYGGIHALKGVSIDINSGEIVTIIGANGAGKSTLLNAVSGFLKYKEGKITYKSGNPSIAAVNSSGKITGKKPGKTTIYTTVQLRNGTFLFCVAFHVIWYLSAAGGFFHSCNSLF